MPNCVARQCSSNHQWGSPWGESNDLRRFNDSYALLLTGLSHEQNMAKMRLLTFMGMAVEFKEISFETMQQELLVGEDDVEAFVIDGK